MKLSVPVKQPDGSFNDGPIGGFTFPNGEKSLIYQCGECGALTRFNTGFNAHKRNIHGVKDNVAFGWADGAPDWQELDMTEGMIKYDYGLLKEPKHE